nr:venom prothrombin activator porpharin-D-like [Paramormyrops kingsleyae]
MAPWIRLLSLTLLSGFFHTDSSLKVFQSPRDASAVLVRPKRANSFLFEEFLQGNLERECMEERCTYEEAREVFENDQKAQAFWTVYYDGDQCQSNPCLHGATCTDKIGGYNCTCTELYQGVNCERDVSQCHSDGPLSCEHFCHPSFHSYKCSCADGYKIHSDGRSCLPEGPYPCGRAPIQSHAAPQPNLSDLPCPQGHCPWQVRLIHANGEEFCRGVILGQHSLLTTGSCVSQDPNFLVIAGPGDEKDPSLRMSVSKIIVHDKYENNTTGSDLAMVQLWQHFPYGPAAFRACIAERDFSENVLMKVGRKGLVGTLSPSYLPLQLCQAELNLTFTLTNKMFCTNAQDAPKAGRGQSGCGLLPGMPIVTMEKRTAFVTGLLISPPANDCSKGYTFTKLSRYQPWIQSHLDNIEK